MESWRIEWKELKSRQCAATLRSPTECESRVISVRFVNVLPATPLVPSDRLSGRARRSTRGCERRRSGRWQRWRPAWRRAAWCTPQTQWRGKRKPVKRERERRTCEKKTLQGRRRERQKSSASKRRCDAVIKKQRHYNALSVSVIASYGAVAL